MTRNSRQSGGLWAEEEEEETTTPGDGGVLLQALQR